MNPPPSDGTSAASGSCTRSALRFCFGRAVPTNFCSTSFCFVPICVSPFVLPPAPEWRRDQTRCCRLEEPLAHGFKAARQLFLLGSHLFQFGRRLAGDQLVERHAEQRGERHQEGERRLVDAVLPFRQTFPGYAQP